MDNFAKNLKFLREKKGHTQTAMQDVLGFSRTTWNNYETGTSYPSFRDLLRIAHYFGVAIDDIVSGTLTPANLMLKEQKAAYNAKSKKTKDPNVVALERLQADYKNVSGDRDILKKQLEFANRTIKSLTDHVDTLKNAMKIQTARIESLQAGKKK